MKKRFFALVTLAVLCAFGLSSCALAENCQANCNHIYGFEKRREATCKLDGAVYHECIKCHYTETIERIPKIAHSYNVTWKKTRGCIGFKSHGVCSSCNETDSRQISFGSIFNSDLCYYHDYDFENPVSVTADESDPDCVLYEYRCKNPDCTDGSATITIHGWNDMLRSWYEENKDSGLNQNKYFMCKTCNNFADAYTLGKTGEEYTVIKEPSAAGDYALVGFSVEGLEYGRCLRLTYEEYETVLAGGKVEFPLPSFMKNM